MSTPSRLFNFNGVPPSRGLVSAWNLSTVNDSFGTNNLTNVNTVTFSAGKITNAANFDGTNYLKVTSNSTLQAGNDLQLTLCGWFKIPSLPTAGNVFGIAGKWDGTDSFEYVVDIDETGALRFIVSSTGAAGGIAIVSAPAIVFANVWYFFVAWYDGTALRIEVNNSGTIFSTAYNADIFTGTAEFRIGNDVDDSRLFLGQIDAIRLYIGRSLVAAERSALYNFGLGREYVTNTIRTADEVNREFDQIINIVNGITQDVGVVIEPTDANNPALLINQNGVGPIAQFYINNILKVEVTNAGQIESFVTTGTQPFAITSSNLVDNLNVDLLDDLNSTDILQVTSYVTFCDSAFFDGTPLTGDRVIVPLHSSSLVQVKIRVRGTASSNAVLLITVMKDVEFEEVITTIGLTGNHQTVVTVDIEETLDVERLIFEITLISGSTKHNDIDVFAITKSSPF